MSLDRRGKVHLEWMFENQPDFVRKLFRENKLYDHLEKKLQQGLLVVDRLKQKGWKEDEAFEVAMENVLAPSDKPDLEKEEPSQRPLSESEQKAVYSKLELDEAYRKQKERRAQPM